MGKLQIDNTNVNVTISREVVSGIAINAAKEIEGIANVTGKFSANDIKALFVKKNIGNGVRVEYLENGIHIDIFIIVLFGAVIPKVARELQEHIKESVSTMTAMNVLSVNVHVVGLSSNKDPKFRNK